jgi:hypothetical protein
MKINKDILYGIISGALVCAFTMIEYLMGYHNAKIADGRFLNLLGNLIPVTVIAIAILYKKKNDGGFLELKDGMKTGIIISFFTGVITTAFMMIYNNYINPEYLQISFDYQIKLLTEKGYSPDDIAKFKEGFDASQKLGAQLVAGLLWTPLLGMLPSLVITLILRKNRP